MNKSTWLKPVLTLVVALALGAGMLFLGTTFAPHQQVAVESGTETVPVVAPIAIGDEEPPADIEQSPTTAEREVRLPGAITDGVDPSLDELIDTLVEAPDPFAALTVLDGDADGAGSGADDDPCAPRDGEPTDECPDGIRSTVLSLLAARDFTTSAYAFPPNYADYLEHGFRAGIWCDGLTPAEGDVPIGILATAPGTYQLELWPTDRPGEVTRLDAIVTPDDQRSAYDEAMATATSIIDVPLIRVCLNVSGLEPDTAYSGFVRGVADDDRLAPPRDVMFNTSGAAVRPSAQIVPLGENLIFASALHQVPQTVDIRVYLVANDAAPSCSIPAAARSLSPLTSAETDVTAGELNEINVLPSYVKKTSETFQLPAGSTALVCVRWYAAGAAPSWERDQPQYESSVIVQNPDRLLPTLTLRSIRDGSASPVQTMTLEVSTAEGTPCGFPVTWTLEDVVRLPLQFCGPGSFSGGGVRSEEDRLWDVGFAGDLVVRGRVVVEVGESNSSMLLPGVDSGCRGNCEIPADRTYRMTMAGVSFDLVESWQLGGGNGRANWNVTPTVDDAPEFVRPDVPQFDLDRQWTFSEPTSRDNFVRATFPLLPDRPVNYVVRFTSSAPGVAATGCGASGAALETSGRALPGVSPTAITFSNVCLGGMYYAELELTDDDGNRVLWGINDRTHWWGSGAVVIAPRLALTIHYVLRAQTVGFSAIRQLDLLLDSYDADAVDGRSGRCTEDGLVDSRGSFDVEVAAVSRISVVLDLERSYSWSETDCLREVESAPTQTIQVDVALADFFRPEGAIVTSTGGYPVNLVLTASVPED